jgi:hypothetical protein
VTDGDDGHFSILSIQRNQVRKIQASVKGGDMREAGNLRKRKVQIVHVEMDDVEFFGALHYVFEHYVMMSELVDAAFVQAQRTWASGYEARSRLRVPAGEQRNFVSHLD